MLLCEVVTGAGRWVHLRIMGADNEIVSVATDTSRRACGIFSTSHRDVYEL